MEVVSYAAAGYTLSTEHSAVIIYPNSRDVIV